MKFESKCFYFFFRFDETKGKSELNANRWMRACNVNARMREMERAKKRIDSKQTTKEYTT